MSVAPSLDRDRYPDLDTLEFDKERHKYTLRGRDLVSATTALEAVLKTSSPWWKASHRLRGEFVHEITRAIDDGDWDPETTRFPASWSMEDVNKVLGRARAYERFLDESGFQAVENEFRVCSTSLGVAGTLDKLGYIRKGKYADVLAIADLKTGAPTPAAKLQVALYDMMLIECSPYRPSLYVILHLRPDGSPRPVYLTCGDIMKYRRIATSVINVYHFMKEEGMA